MKHKFFFVLFGVLSIQGYIQAFNNERSIEIKSGYFFFSDAKMRKIYNQGGIDIQMSGSYPFWKFFQVYGSVEYLERNGRSLNFHQKAHIWEVPLSLGIKTILPICKKLDYYFTLGPRYFFVHTHNHSSYVDKHLSQNGIGGFANMGLHFSPVKHFFIDVFGEYSYGRMRFHALKTHTYSENVQVGGFVFGGSLGLCF